VDEGDLVYLGHDSVWLLEAVWKLATGGRRAVELGTGTGLLAAALAPRYGLTVATDILPTTAAVAALTFLLNPLSTGRLAAVSADVARGLRPGSFDLVVANAPWVPAPAPGVGGRPRVFADGGPTGQELPARFILEGSALLAPGGLGVTQCLDLTYDDGRRPLADLCGALRTEGLSAELRPVGPPEIGTTLTDRLGQAGFAGVAQLVDVIVERPGRPCP
jgi:methylase of polypeptide subunit release factors